MRREATSLLSAYKGLKFLTFISNLLTQYGLLSAYKGLKSVSSPDLSALMLEVY